MAWFYGEIGVYGQPGYGSKPVGTKQANAWGLYDMHGNLLEFTQDWYGLYTRDAKTSPTGPATGVQRVLRGGAPLIAATTAPARRTATLSAQ
jgi:formylglycine-generating enzyme required for sulfatase activity